MGLTMKEKQAVTKQLALSYKRARKKEKGKILDTVIELSGSMQQETIATTNQGDPSSHALLGAAILTRESGAH